MNSRVLWSILGIVLFGSSCIAQNTGLGTPPFGSFTGGTPYDVINNQNLNVHLLINLESVASRQSSFSFSAINDSQIWQPVNSAWAPIVDAFGTPTWGWQTGNPNGSLSRTQVANGSCLLSGGGGTTVTTYTENNFVYTDSQGTQHKFPSVNQVQSCVNNQVVTSGTYSGYASDASGYFLNSQIGPSTGAGGFPGGVVISPSGLQYQNSGHVTYAYG